MHPWSWWLYYQVNQSSKKELIKSQPFVILISSHFDGETSPLKHFFSTGILLFILVHLVKILMVYFDNLNNIFIPFF